MRSFITGFFQLAEEITPHARISRTEFMEVLMPSFQKLYLSPLLTSPILVDTYTMVL